MYSSVAATFFQRTPSRVEWAPHPKPSHSPSIQYFRLWRDRRPARATFDISVLQIAGGVQPLHRRQVHGHGVLVGRLRPARARHVVLERRVRVHLEQVQRQVLGRQGDGRVDRRQPVLDALRRQPHHQVEADVVEPGGAGFADGGARAVGGVQPRQPRAAPRRGNDCTPKLRRLTPGLPVRAQPGFGHRLGVRLERDLAVGRHVERRSHAPTMRATSSGSSSDGVPPPK